MDINIKVQCLPNERWRFVKGFENVYAISDKGRLASNKLYGWRILSNKNSKGDYLAVILRDKDKVSHTRIHRLVYENFVGEIPSGKKHHIHHINHNKQDNRVENLALVSAKEHYQLDIDSKNISGLRPIWENFQGKACYKKKVIQKTLNGEIIATYESAQEAYLATGVCARNIRQVASKEPYNKKGNIRKQAGGYIWEDVVE